MIALLFLAIIVLTGKMAHDRKRPVLLWVIQALFLSLLSPLLLLLVGELREEYRS